MNPPIMNPPIITSAVGALGLCDLGTEDDPGCVGCGEQTIVGMNDDAILFEHRGRYWHVHCAEKVLSATERQHRPRNYHQLSPEEQWTVDKRLGLLDEPVEPAVPVAIDSDEITADPVPDEDDDAPHPDDVLPVRFTPIGEEVARQLALDLLTYSVEDVAGYLGMSETYFLDLLKAGELPPLRLYVEDLEAFEKAWQALRHARAATGRIDE